METLLTDDHSGVEKPAAIIIETVQAEGGVHVFSNEYLQGVRALCDKYDILMIVDDIQVGCARTGTFFSFERANIKPDMVILSKSISGFGLPMSILLMKPEYDIFKPAEHNGTFRGNQLAFVGSKAGMEYFNSHNLPDTVKANERYISEYLKEHILPIDERLRIRGIGMIWGIDFANIDPKLALEASHRCFDKGLVIELAGRNDSVLKILPPLTIENQHLNKGLKILTQEVKQLLR